MRAQLRQVESPLSALSAREREILHEVATGKNNATVAAALTISEHAVEKHINSIFSKLRLGDDGTTHRRVAAVLLYLSQARRRATAGRCRARPLGSPERRLARLLGTDLATCVVGVAVMLAVHVVVFDSTYLLLLAAMVAGAGLLMAVAFVPLRRGRVRMAVAFLAAANYLVALGTTTIATFAMPILLLATMLPPVLAVPYVSRRQLRWCVAASFAVAVGVSILGTLQDVTRFSESLPDWLPSAVIVLFTPFMAAMVSIIALTNEGGAGRQRRGPAGVARAGRHRSRRRAPPDRT